MIKGLNISKKYKKFELQPTSIEIDKGEIVALIGENGAGKSTLIKCMCGVIDADEGQLEVDDQVVKKLDDVLVLGFMNQDQNVYNEIKIRDLTNFVKDVMKKKFDQEVYYYYFKEVFQLDDEVLDILRCVTKEKNTSVLFSSHITEDIEKIADRVIFINNGRIVLQGDKKEIKKKYVKLNQQQYVILVNAGMAKECVSIHDYYIVDRDLAMTCNVEVKEALLSDILSYMRKRSED